MWKLEFTHRARKDLLSLDKQLQKRILEKLDAAAKNPKTSFAQLAGYDFSKLRIGDYRAIALLDEKNSRITIQRIGHRRNIYTKI